MIQKKPHQKDIDYALQLFNRNQLNEARDFTNALLEKFPNDPLTLNICGACHAGLGELNIAVEKYRQSILAKPDYSKAYFNLGTALQELNQLEDSVRSYENAINFEPENPKLYNNLAIVFSELNQLKDAEKNCRKALDLNPKYAEAHSCLALILYKNGDLDSALERINIAHSLNPNLKIINLLVAILKSKKLHKDSKPDDIFNKSNKGYLKVLTHNPLILERPVEKELIDELYNMKSIELDKTNDPSYGDARGSGYQLFPDNHSVIIKNVRSDLLKIIKKATRTDIYIKDSFYTILGAGGGVHNHNHISALDLDPSLNLARQKFSLVYYLCVGDQNCTEPGRLKLYDPIKNILPEKSMIVIFPADRYHSVVYNGKKDRVIIGINFYCL